MNAFVYNDLKQIYKYCALEFDSSNIKAIIIDLKNSSSHPDGSLSITHVIGNRYIPVC